MIIQRRRETERVSLFFFFPGIVVLLRANDDDDARYTRREEHFSLIRSIVALLARASDMSLVISTIAYTFFMREIIISRFYSGKYYTYIIDKFAI